MPDEKLPCARFGHTSLSFCQHTCLDGTTGRFRPRHVSLLVRKRCALQPQLHHCAMTQMQLADKQLECQQHSLMMFCTDPRPPTRGVRHNCRSSRLAITNTASDFLMVLCYSTGGVSGTLKRAMKSPLRLLESEKSTDLSSLTAISVTVQAG